MSSGSDGQHQTRFSFYTSSGSGEEGLPPSSSVGNNSTNTNTNKKNIAGGKMTKDTDAGGADQQQKQPPSGSGGARPGGSSIGGSSRTSKKKENQAQEKVPLSPSKLVYSFYQSGDLDSVLQPTTLRGGGGSGCDKNDGKEKGGTQEEEGTSSGGNNANADAAEARSSEDRPSPSRRLMESEIGGIHDHEKAEEHQIYADEDSDEEDGNDTSLEGGEGEIGKLPSLSDIVTSSDEEVGLYHHHEYEEEVTDEEDYVDEYEQEEGEEEEGESAESILAKLSLEEEEMRIKKSRSSASSSAAASGSAADVLRRGLQQTPKHRNVGSGQIPPPVMGNGSGLGVPAAAAVSERDLTAAAIDAYGILVGDDYGTARDLGGPSLAALSLEDQNDEDGNEPRSIEDTVRDALRLVRQRAAEKKRIQQHREEIMLHHHQRHQQQSGGEQASLMVTPSRLQAQVEGQQRQLEPPLEHVGVNASGSSSLVAGPAAVGLGLATADLVSPVLPATPGQTSLLSPSADVRKLASSMSSDMFRPPSEATPGRPVNAASSEAQPTLDLAHPVMSSSAATPARPAQHAHHQQLQQHGSESDTNDEALERGLELVLTAILEQSRGRGGKKSGGVSGAENALDEAVSSLFGISHDKSHLADDRFSRPSRKISAEVGGALGDEGTAIPPKEDARINKMSVAEQLLAESDDDDEVDGRVGSGAARLLPPTVSSCASPSSTLVESSTSPREMDGSGLVSNADINDGSAADLSSRASSTSTGAGKQRVLGRLSKSMGGRTGIVLSDETEADEDEDEQSFGATVESQVTEQSHEMDGGEGSSPGTPSLLRSLSDKIGLTTSESPKEQDAAAKEHYEEADVNELENQAALFRGVNKEAHALMKILCAHLLPVGLAKSAKKSENDSSPVKSIGSWLSGSAGGDDDEDSLANPSWDEDDPDEPGYVVHRLSTTQLHDVEREFNIMINHVQQSSERRLMEAGVAKAEGSPDSTEKAGGRSSISPGDDDFERDLEEAEELLDREEQRIKAEQKAAAAVVKRKSTSPMSPSSRRTSDEYESENDESSSSSSDESSSSSTKNTSDAASSPSLESESDVDDSLDVTDDHLSAIEDDLVKLAGGSSTIPAHLAGNPNFPHVYPSGQGRRGDMELFHLPIIYKAQQTGFEPTKDLVLQPGAVFAGQYLVQNELGTAAFSTAYRCIDLHSGQRDDDGEEYHEEVCLKVIKNTKDFFDQSLDEIKVLELLRRTGQCEQNCIVEMKTFFYHREHLVIVTELLRQNLYEFGKFIVENDEPPYFTRKRLCYITRQSLIALDFIHKLGFIHSDVKPENILLSSYSKAKVKLIDFGSSCYLTDRQSSYIQSRSYRAPEVVLGLPYDGKIDIWSLGCVIAEMYTGLVTFQNDSVVSMLSRIEAICGAFPRHLIANGRQSGQFFTASGLLYEKVDVDDESRRRSSHAVDSDEDASVSSEDEDHFNIFQPKSTTLAARLGFEPDLLGKNTSNLEEEECAMFVDFLRSLLTIDPDARPSAEEALQHPWILSGFNLSEKDIKYPPE